MKGYVSRRKNKAAIVLLAVFGFLAILGCIAQSVVLELLSLPLLVAAVILMFSANRCPHCGAFFRGLYWAKCDAGYCNACGKLIEFDDCAQV